MSEVYIVTALIKITLDIRKASEQATRNKRRMMSLCDRAEWFVDLIEQVRTNRDFKPSELARLQRLHTILEEILEFVQNSNSRGWLRRLWQATSDKDAIELFHDDIDTLRGDMSFFLAVDDDGIARRPYPPKEGRFDWEDFQQILDDLSKDNDEAINTELQLANIPKERVRETLKRKVNESKALSVVMFDETTGMRRITSFAKMLKPEHFRPNLRTLSKEKHSDFVIGDGAFGTVFKSIWETRGFEVAVKVLKCKQFSKKAEESLRHEVEIMANLGHNDHVIDVFGFYADPAGNFALVMSYAPGGSLRDRLDRADFTSIPWSQKWEWVEGIAKGMAWLHSADPRIIHRDLKSDNILLGQRGEARVSDFGCAIAKSETAINLGGGNANGSTAGSQPWFPPEAFMEGIQEAAGDVYAFAIVMWEIATGQLPWPGTGPSLIPGLVKEGQRPSLKNISGDGEYVSLMTRCWQQNPSARPSFGLIADELSCRHYSSAYSLKSKASSSTTPKPAEGASADSTSTSQQDTIHGTMTSTTDASSAGGSQMDTENQESVPAPVGTDKEEMKDSVEILDEPPTSIEDNLFSNNDSTVETLPPPPLPSVASDAEKDVLPEPNSDANLMSDRTAETNNSNVKELNSVGNQQQTQENDEEQQPAKGSPEISPILPKPSSVNVKDKEKASSSSLPIMFRVQHAFEDLRAKLFSKNGGTASINHTRSVGLSRASEGPTNQSPDTTEADPEQQSANHSSVDHSMKRSSQPSKQVPGNACGCIQLTNKQKICLVGSMVVIIILAIVLGVTLSPSSNSGGSNNNPPLGDGDDKNDTTTVSPPLTTQLLVGDGSIKPSNFGFTVALSGDGKTAVVGGTEDNDGLGATWVFAAPTNANGKWAKQGPKLTSALVGGATLAPSTTFFPNEGMDVALDADGNKAIVGMQNGNNGLGIIYKRTTQPWTKEAALQAPNIFAYEVAISAAGTTTLIGGFSFLKQGRPRVFTRSLTEGKWNSGLVLNGTGAIADTNEMYFAVALSADGTTAFIGEPNDNTKLGAMWAFQRQGSEWVQQGPKLVGTGAAGASQQGRTVALSATGNIAVSCGVADDFFQGALWTFQRAGSIWTQLGSKFTISGAFNMGNSLALNAAGDVALVTIERGSNIDALLLHRSGQTWGFRQFPLQIQLSPFDHLSVALSSNGQTAMIGDWQNETVLLIENINITKIFG